jgi:hypothetical protein
VRNEGLLAQSRSCHIEEMAVVGKDHDLATGGEARQRS